MSCGLVAGGCRPDGSSGKVKLVTIEPRDEGAIISKIAMSERGRDRGIFPCINELYFIIFILFLIFFKLYDES